MSQPTKPLAPLREIFGWAMFDFANSSYTTVIVTVVYCQLFTQMVVGPDPDGTFGRGNLLWSVALAVSYGLVVLTAPVLGAIMDFASSKKRFLFASYVLTVASTALLWLAAPGYVWLAMALVVVSNFGFGSGESFASSFLPDLGPKEDLGRISGFAWGLGYFGGLASVLLVTGLGASDASDFSRSRWTGPLVAGFFLVAAIPTFLWVKQRGTPQPLPPGRTYVGIGFERLADTLRGLQRYRDLMVLLLAVFFATAGLSIVIAFAFLYGQQVLHWSPGTEKGMFILTQLSAAGGALVFGFLQDRIGAKRTFQITLWLWVLSVLAIWQVEAIASVLNRWFGTGWRAEQVFLGLGTLAGLGIGSTQSACRALVGILSPESKAGEFFGFWGLSGKLAAIAGLLSFGLLQRGLGLKHSIPLCAVLFLVALAVSVGVDEARGRAEASRA